MNPDTASESSATMPFRQSASPLELMVTAAGSPTQMRDKLIRLVYQFAGMLDRTELHNRLRRLHARGRIESVPNDVQLFVGAIDMLRFWISPAAAEYYEQQGLSYTFHQVLRFLDEPASITDPIGLFSSRDGIIGHVMQVVHANPVYDLELLDMFDDGLDAFESQLEAMLANTHPRAASIRAVVEDAAYHTRLLAFLRAWRRNESTAGLVRNNVANNPRWQPLERTFGSLRTSFRYFAKMPREPISALVHLTSVAAFPHALAEP